MNKLYHSFRVFSYKGGELSYNINLTLKSLIYSYLENIGREEIHETCADEEEFSDMPDEKFYNLTYVQLVDKLSNDSIKGFIRNQIYPGNIYAFDNFSDSKIFTTNEKGKLVEIDITEEPQFIEVSKKVLREIAKEFDKYESN